MDSRFHDRDDQKGIFHDFSSASPNALPGIHIYGGSPTINIHPPADSKTERKPMPRLVLFTSIAVCAVFLFLNYWITKAKDENLRYLIIVGMVLSLAGLCWCTHEVSMKTWSFLFPLVSGLLIMSISFKITTINEFLSFVNRTTKDAAANKYPHKTTDEDSLRIIANFRYIDSLRRDSVLKASLRSPTKSSRKIG